MGAGRAGKRVRVTPGAASRRGTWREPRAGARAGSPLARSMAPADLVKNKTGGTSPRAGSPPDAVGAGLRSGSPPRGPRQIPGPGHPRMPLASGSGPGRPRRGTMSAPLAAAAPPLPLPLFFFLFFLFLAREKNFWGVGLDGSGVGFIRAAVGSRKGALSRWRRAAGPCAALGRRPGRPLAWEMVEIRRELQGRVAPGCRWRWAQGRATPGRGTR